eukprot:614261-Alexandrium_andersonii.AAC.1
MAAGGRPADWRTQTVGVNGVVRRVHGDSTAVLVHRLTLSGPTAAAQLQAVARNLRQKEDLYTPGQRLM